MRTNRVLVAPPVTYRMSSALSDDIAAWSKQECRELYDLVTATAAFCRMELRYLCVWRRGLDMLVHAPAVPKLSDEELAIGVEAFWRDAHGVRAAAALRGEYGARATSAARLRVTRFLSSVPMFGKSVKQRWTGNYRDAHGGAGTIWRDRFRSRPVAKDAEIQLRMAGAIEAAVGLPWRTAGKPGFQVSTSTLAEEGDDASRRGLRAVTGATRWTSAGKALTAAAAEVRRAPADLEYGTVKGRRIEANGKDPKMWESSFKQWEKILRKYPDGKLPVDVPDDPLLRHWASQQRMAAGKGDLSQERIKRLKTIGVLTFERMRQRPLQPPSDTMTKQWSANFKAVRSLKQRTGAFTLSGDDRITRRLRAWMSQQRAYYHEGILPEKKLQKLQSIDFEWRPPRGRPRRS